MLTGIMRLNRRTVLFREWRSLRPIRKEPQTLDQFFPGAQLGRIGPEAGQPGINKLSAEKLIRRQRRQQLNFPLAEFYSDDWHWKPRLRGLPAIVSTLAAATAAAKAAVGFGTRFIDVQRAATQVAAIQLSDRAIRFRVAAHLDESESLRLPGVAIRDDADALDRAVRLEHGPDCVFGRSEAEISYKNVFHFSSLLIEW
jgi:hypothetical protein